MCHRVQKLILAMTCVMAVMFGPAQDASAKSITSPENIVSGEFFAEPVSLHQEMPPEPLRMQQGEWSSRMKTVSGRRVWLSPDPIKEDGGLNLYAYVSGDPINLWDPMGLIDGTMAGAAVSSGYYKSIEPVSENLQKMSTAEKVAYVAWPVAVLPVAWLPSFGLGAGTGLLFDGSVTLVKNRNNTGKPCPTNSSGSPIGNATAGGAVGATSATETKPRMGVQGGGKSGMKTSQASKLNHNLATKGVYSIGKRNIITKGLRSVPYLGAAIGAYQMGDAILNPTSNGE